MEGALTVKIVMVMVTMCGAMPTMAPNQEQLSKAQVR